MPDEQTALAIHDLGYSARGVVRPYDRVRCSTCIRLLDADSDGPNWREVVAIVLSDPERDPERARRAFESHLARAQWMTE